MKKETISKPTLYPHKVHQRATIDFIRAVSVMGFNKVSVDTAKKGAMLLMRKLKIKP